MKKNKISGFLLILLSVPITASVIYLQELTSKVNQLSILFVGLFVAISGWNIYFSGDIKNSFYPALKVSSILILIFVIIGLTEKILK